MAETANLLKLHVDTLTGGIPGPELSGFTAAAETLDARLLDLYGDAPSPNRITAIRDAHRQAEEAIGRVLEAAQLRLGPAIAKAHADLVERPEIASNDSHFRLKEIRDRLPSDLGPLEIRAMWNTLPTEMKDALLHAPPRIRRAQDGGVDVEELVDPATREAEMRTRRPAEAQRYDGLTGALKRVQLVGNHLRESVKQRKKRA